jgi:hypothetical protein
MHIGYGDRGYGCYTRTYVGMMWTSHSKADEHIK